MLQLCLAHAAAGVADAQQHAVAVRFGFDQHLAAFVVVLDGIGQQVQQHLAQARRIGQRHAGQCRAAQLDLALPRRARHQRQRLGHQRRQRHRLQADADLAAFQAGQVEHVVDQRQQVLAGHLDLLQAAPACFGRDLLAVAEHQLREAQHRVQRRAQLMAHARQELRLGLALALRQQLFLARVLCGARVGDVPVDADAPRRLALLVAQRDRARGDQPPLAVGPAHAELQVRRPARAGGLGQLAQRELAVVGVHQRHALVHAQRLRARLQPAQPPHLFVPVGLAAEQVQLPGAHAGAARGQRRALAGAVQRGLGGAAFGHVHQHAEEVVAARRAFEPRIAEHVARRAIAAHDAQFLLQVRPAALHPGQVALPHRVAIGRMHETLQPLGIGQRRAARRQPVQLEGLFAPACLAGLGFDAPVADAGGACGQLELPHQLGVPAAALDTLAQVQAHTQQRGRAALGITLQDAPRQHVAPAAVGMAEARFHVHRLFADQGLFKAGAQRGPVVGVHHGAQLFGAEFGARARHAQQFEGSLADADAVAAQVVAEDDDVGQRQRQAQLFAGLGMGACLGPGLGVVDEDAEHALGQAVGAVLHHPLRMQLAQHAVGAAHAVAVRIAAGAAQRLAEGLVQRRAVLVQDRLRGTLEVGCAVVFGQAPDAVHVAVPAALQRVDVALPHAEPAEVLRQVQQFGQAARVGRMQPLFFHRLPVRGAAAVGQQAQLRAPPAPADAADLHVGQRARPAVAQRVVQRLRIGRRQAQQQRQALAAALGRRAAGQVEQPAVAPVDLAQRIAQRDGRRALLQQRQCGGGVEPRRCGRAGRRRLQIDRFRHAGRVRGKRAV